jgi:hypothetical protein
LHRRIIDGAGANGAGLDDRATGAPQRASQVYFGHVSPLDMPHRRGCDGGRLRTEGPFGSAGSASTQRTVKSDGTAHHGRTGHHDHTDIHRQPTGAGAGRARRRAEVSGTGRAAA